MTGFKFLSGILTMIIVYVCRRADIEISTEEVTKMILDGAAIFGFAMTFIGGVHKQWRLWKVEGFKLNMFKLNMSK